MSPSVRSIVLVGSSAKAGGAERALVGLARHLPTVGFRPHVVLLERGPAEAWLAAVGCRAEIAANDGRPDAAIEVVRKLAVWTEARAVLSSKWEAHLIGGVAAANAGLPAVWWQHDIAQKNPDELRAASLPAKAIVCGSEYAVEAQRRFAPSIPIVKIHPGIPVAEVARRAGSGARVRQLLGWPRSPLVGIIGRLERWKGQKTFLRSARLVADRRPDVRFAVVGGALKGSEGSYPDDLRELAADLGIADRVHFAGHQDDPYPWFDALDVVVHASAGEPFGLVVVEAMALGKPVVATMPGGPAEVVEDWRSGLLVPANAEQPLADAVLRILDDPELAARLGEGGRRRARQFTEQKTAEHFGLLFDQILSGDRSSPP